MTTYGQTIILDNGRSGGDVTVSGCTTLTDATMKAVDIAIRDGWYPPRWHQFWRPKCPDHVRKEYERQTVKGPRSCPHCGADGMSICASHCPQRTTRTRAQNAPVCHDGLHHHCARIPHCLKGECIGRVAEGGR